MFVDYILYSLWDLKIPMMQVVDYSNDVSYLHRDLKCPHMDTRHKIISTRFAEGRRHFTILNQFGFVLVEAEGRPIIH